MLDGVRFAVLHPTDVSLAHELRPNENSVIVRVSYGAFDAVLTGDAGFPAESVAVSRVGRSEVLKVGHHGSAGATGNAWLDAVAPKVAVISVGAHNRYGHPAPATLRRLARRGISMWRTDDGGTVTIWSDGRYFQVSQGTLLSPVARLRCLVRSWSRSKASSSKKNACTPKPAASSPTSFTTWPSPPS
jgi:competence protein ComEC